MLMSTTSVGFNGVNETSDFGPDDPVTELFGSVSGWNFATTRTVNALATHGIKKTRQLTALTERDLRAWPGFGNKCVTEVKRVLTAHGMTLKGENGTDFASECTRLYTPQGAVAHLQPPLSSGVKTVLCPRMWPWPDGWLGTGSQAEYEKAAALPTCKECLKRAGGWLRAAQLRTGVPPRPGPRRPRPTGA